MDSKPSNSIATVDIRPGVSILSILRHVNYRAWFALAEFVDNSLESYRNNRLQLEAIHGDKFQLEVNIDISSNAPGRISIRDNAAGIAYAQFSRAFRPAAIPDERSGFAEFGMGMKSAACWFAGRWKVRTSAIGEPIERIVSFDVDQIVNDEIEELTIEENDAPSEIHFTEIVLEDLHHRPMGRTIGKIKDHLAGIYREFTRTSMLKLIVNRESMTYDEPQILRAPLAGTDEDAKLWRKEVDFDFGNGLYVRGFAALMDPGTYSKSGFALFRRGRLIQGSGDEGYRPTAIFGRTRGSYRALRLFGELRLENFEISHTKDGFRWDENEEPFLDLLREHLNSEELPLLTQADSYRARAQRNQLTDAATEAIDKTVNVLSNPDFAEDVHNASRQPAIETQTGPLDDVSKIVVRELEIPFEGRNWLVKVELVNDIAQSEWLSFIDQPRSRNNPNVLVIRLNLAHPFMVRFAQTDSQDIEALLRVAAALALSEKVCRIGGIKFAGTIRMNINNLLGGTLSKP